MTKTDMYTSGKLLKAAQAPVCTQYIFFRKVECMLTTHTLEQKIVQDHFIFFNLSVSWSYTLIINM